MFKMSNPENFGGNFSLFCEFLIFTFLVASMPKPPNTRRRTRYILSTVNAKRLPIALAPSWVSYRLDLSTDANPRPIGNRKIRKIAAMAFAQLDLVALLFPTARRQTLTRTGTPLPRTPNVQCARRRVFSDDYPCAVVPGWIKA